MGCVGCVGYASHARSRRKLEERSEYVERFCGPFVEIFEVELERVALDQLDGRVPRSDSRVTPAEREALLVRHRRAVIARFRQ